MPDFDPYAAAGYVAPVQATAQNAELQGQVTALQSQVAKLQAQVDSADAPVWAKYREYETRLYTEKIQMLDYRVELYQWTKHAGDVMLWTAVAVVLCGLVLSAAQFVQAMRLGQREDGTIDLSVTGLKITSSVTGILILGMSLAFIYIFVQQVYTVHDPAAKVPPEPAVTTHTTTGQ